LDLSGRPTAVLILWLSRLAGQEPLGPVVSLAAEGLPCKALGASVCIPAIVSGITFTAAAERQNVNGRGWSAAQPPESKSCGPCRVAASQSRDGRARGAAPRLSLASAGDRGLCCAPPPAIRFTPLRGGLPDDSRHPARSLMRRNGNAPRKTGCIPVIEPIPSIPVPRSGKMGVAGGGAQRNPRNQDRTAHAA
jgi:hypothetical protein